MLITNRRPASDNWWNKRVLDSCICFLRGEKTHRCYNEISYSLFPILLSHVSCYGIVKFYCDFSKVLVGFSDKIKRTVSNAHLYTGKTLFCPCNVYNLLHLELKRAFYEKISKVNTLTIVDLYTQLNYGLYNFFETRAQTIWGENYCKKNKSSCGRDVRVKIPTNNKSYTCLITFMYLINYL